MNSTVKGSLILDENQSGGTLLSPGCTLILKYESEGKIPIVPSTSIERVSPKTREDVCRETISALENIPGIEMPDVQSSLFQFGFSRSERNQFQSSDDLLASLGEMVRLADDFGKLDNLIDNAVRRSQDKNNQGKLEECKRVYCAKFKFLDYKSPPLPLKDEA